MPSVKTKKANPWLDGFLFLLYPDTCINCKKVLNQYENYLCRKCINKLPLTRFELRKDNPVAQTFWGRIPINFATSVYHYRKGETLQKLISRLKYQNTPKIGIALGQLAGKVLIKTQIQPEINYLIPVPLHPKRKHQRGYNQCEMIANGISTILNIPVETTLLKRHILNPSQTKKGRYERWENVEGIFKVSGNSKPLYNKHILIIDDIITTGATLEACCSALTKIPGVTISVLTIGYANRY